MLRFTLGSSRFTIVDQVLQSIFTFFAANPGETLVIVGMDFVDATKASLILKTNFK